MRRKEVLDSGDKDSQSFLFTAYCCIVLHLYQAYDKQPKALNTSECNYRRRTAGRLERAQQSDRDIEGTVLLA